MLFLVKNCNWVFEHQVNNTFIPLIIKAMKNIMTSRLIDRLLNLQNDTYEDRCHHHLVEPKVLKLLILTVISPKKTFFCYIKNRTKAISQI